MRKLFPILLTGLLYGCTMGVPLKKVDYNSLLNDGNSKVWIISKQIVGGMNIVNGGIRNYDLMIFHESGSVDIVPMKSLGTSSGKHGFYYLDSQNQTIEFIFNDQEEWIMKLTYLTEDSLYMKSMKGSDVQFDLQIKPLPEFY